MMEDWTTRVYRKGWTAPEYASFQARSASIRLAAIESITGCSPSTARRLAGCPVGEKMVLVGKDREITVIRFA